MSTVLENDRATGGRVLAEIAPLVPGLAVLGIILAFAEASITLLTSAPGTPDAVQVFAATRSFLDADTAGGMLLCSLLVYGLWWRFAGDINALADAGVFLATMMVAATRGTPFLQAALGAFTGGITPEDAARASMFGIAGMGLTIVCGMAIWIAARRSGMTVSRMSWITLTVAVAILPISIAGDLARYVVKILPEAGANAGALALPLLHDVLGMSQILVLVAIAGVASFFSTRNGWRREMAAVATYVIFLGWLCLTSAAALRAFVEKPLQSQELDVLITFGIELVFHLIGLVVSIFMLFRNMGLPAWRPNDKHARATERF